MQGNHKNDIEKALKTINRFFPNAVDIEKAISTESCTFVYVFNAVVVNPQVRITITLVSMNKSQQYFIIKQETNTVPLNTQDALREKGWKHGKICCMELPQKTWSDFYKDKIDPILGFACYLPEKADTDQSKSEL